MLDSSPITAYVALGSNLGDRAGNIAAALDRLACAELTVTKVSSLLENRAVGGPADSPDFLNAVAEIRTSLDPHRLLDRLLDVEAQLGRVRSRKWEPRVIDLDIVLYAGQVLSSPRLTIPHPLMHERAFVMIPLAQIAPDALHPILKQTAAQLRDRFKAEFSGD
jgi:2-amino-4-hydroxy-6-hydroxymethyldihydropteridine diphosphokinase